MKTAEPSPAGAPGHILALTGLRGVAALLVVYSHLLDNYFLLATPLLPGQVGVMVFFSLSGFLMALLYGHKPFTVQAATRYAIARMARIAPAYLTVVVVSYLICSFIDPHFVYTITNANLLRHLAFSGNVSALWSIPPEVQFYGVFMAAWAALWAFLHRRNPVHLLLVLGLLGLMLVYRTSLPGTFVGSKLHFFLGGALLGLARARLGGVTVLRVAAVLQGVILLVLALTVSGIIPADFGNRDVFYTSLPAALASAITVFAFSFDTGLAKRLLGNAAMSRCGDWSFSIYLINFPVIYCTTHWLDHRAPTPGITVAIVLAVLGLAWAMYHAIELPGGRLLRALGQRVLLARLKAPEPAPLPATSDDIHPVPQTVGTTSSDRFPA